MDSLGSLNAFVQAAEARSFTVAGTATWRVVVGDRQGGGADGGTARRAPLSSQHAQHHTNRGRLGRFDFRRDAPAAFEE
jgi:hypothetical protein